MPTPPITADRLPGAGLTAVRAALLMGALLLAAFCLACALVEPESGQPDGGWVERLLGGTRIALGGQFYEQADRYFHRGVGHSTAKAFDDPFQRIGRQITPEEHQHTAGFEVGEIMPWLRWTTRMDPHNVEAYLVAAYWAAGPLKQPDAAERIYREALRMNPGDYRVAYDWARWALRRGDQDRAAHLLDSALHCWPAPLDTADGQAQLDRKGMLEFHAALRRPAGTPGPAPDSGMPAGIAWRHGWEEHR